ncbi:MAG TPA: hypothetical protein PLF85_13075 [Turneriella sp.]|jgi:hypothetical protein|nr:hypothetical protein [Turneriella sp.]HNE20651.1 hypothetical protein [Turneriella sp.]
MSRTKEAPEGQKEEAPNVDVKGFLAKCDTRNKSGEALREAYKSLEQFQEVARSYGRVVTVNAGRVDHNIPADQLPWMIALIK